MQKSYSIVINVFCKTVKQHLCSHWRAQAGCTPVHDLQALVNSLDQGGNLWVLSWLLVLTAQQVSAGDLRKGRSWGGSQKQQHLHLGSQLEKVACAQV